MKMWQTPKTNWTMSDFFTLTPDYARIRGNLMALQIQAKTLYEPISQTEMALYTQNDVPTARFYNVVEDNMFALLEGSFMRAGYTKKLLSAGAPAWNSADLNRLEGGTLWLHNLLLRQAEATPKLTFQLKGSDF